MRQKKKEQAKARRKGWLAGPRGESYYERELLAPGGEHRPRKTRKPANERDAKNPKPRKKRGVPVRNNKKVRKKKRGKKEKEEFTPHIPVGAMRKSKKTIVQVRKKQEEHIQAPWRAPKISAKIPQLENSER